ncbi:MAG: hypothetical protein NZM35_06070 [Chitinophagales bacterium]|nr:hypothetical protein [Chitinophagales bacterium]MDW8417977.1 hypothetical protein [Chitinophagales bacterium]
MSFSAKVMMIAAQLTVTVFTAYFFFRVLLADKRKEPDSYAENDQEV